MPITEQTVYTQQTQYHFYNRYDDTGYLNLQFGRNCFSIDISENEPYWRNSQGGLQKNPYC